jgi:hypothetical protein
MLRITTNRNAQALVLQLEGRLYGPWVAVLEECWNSARANLRGRRLCADLSGVTFVDAAGKAKLAEMYAHGAELLSDDIETKAIVVEIQMNHSKVGDDESKPASNNCVDDGRDLHERLTRLQRLQGELHEVNEELAQASRPLERIAELNEQQRQEVAGKIRAGLARWESLTQQIHQAMETDRANGQGTSKSNRGELQ